jgi:hypothetical protein
MPAGSQPGAIYRSDGGAGTEPLSPRLAISPDARLRHHRAEPRLRLPCLRIEGGNAVAPRGHQALHGIQFIDADGSGELRSKIKRLADVRRMHSCSMQPASRGGPGAGMMLAGPTCRLMFHESPTARPTSNRSLLLPVSTNIAMLNLAISGSGAVSHLKKAILQLQLCCYRGG